jgi:hypothetical protein
LKDGGILVRKEPAVNSEENPVLHRRPHGIGTPVAREAGRDEKDRRRIFSSGAKDDLISTSLRPAQWWIRVF